MKIQKGARYLLRIAETHNTQINLFSMTVLKRIQRPKKGTQRHEHIKQLLILNENSGTSNCTGPVAAISK